MFRREKFLSFISYCNPSVVSYNEEARGKKRFHRALDTRAVRP